jgi:hypothetical protein
MIAVSALGTEGAIPICWSHRGFFGNGECAMLDESSAEGQLTLGPRRHPLPDGVEDRLN